MSASQFTIATLPPAAVNVRILFTLALVIGVSRLSGWAMSRVGQPKVHGEILAGILLGPSLFGQIWGGGLEFAFPAEVLGGLRVLAQLGVVLFMFLVGLDLDLDKLRGHGHRAVVISHASILVPIVLGGALGAWLYPRFGDGVDRTGFMLFLGAAMAITAFPVLARVLQETGLDHTRIGVLAITCAAVDDVTAWCVLAAVVAVIEATGPIDTIRVLSLSLGFLAVMLLVVRPHLRRLPDVPLWTAISMALLGAWLTEQIGIHAIFGAFMVGAVMPRRESIRMAIEDRLESVTLTFLLPVFFVVVGMSTRVDRLNSTYLWAVAVLVITVAVVGKLGGSMLAARILGESWSDAATIGILMNTRGLTELVILTVGLELGVINSTLFTLMVLMALVTTLMATPMLSLVSPLYHRGQTVPEVEADRRYGMTLQGPHVGLTEAEARSLVASQESRKPGIRMPPGEVVS